MLNPRRIGVRVADHPMHIARLSKPLTRALRELMAAADDVITPNENTADYLQTEFGCPVKLVPNGVDVAHFKQARELPPEYREDTRQKVIFVGALARWIDIDLIRRLAELCKDLAFYLVGPNHNQALKHLPYNLIYLGSRPYEEIPAYLQHANAAIAPFDVEALPDFIETIDAIKLYEYAAAGLPTVATRWSQSRRLFPCVVAVDQKPQAFADALRSVLREPQQHQASGEYLQSLDWSARLATWA
jgi:glycosyltransferase involved in cell wall biosynthesis